MVFILGIMDEIRIEVTYRDRDREIDEEGRGADQEMGT